MRSVSLFLPAGLRTPSKTPQGPASQQAPLRPAPPESENHSGVGIVLDASEDGRLVVEHVWPGSPAAVAGIRPGDVLRASVELAKKARHDYWASHGAAEEAAGRLRPLVAASYARKGSLTSDYSAVL